MNAIRFGTDGWRAIVADQFTMENVRVVAQAIAAYTIRIGQKEQGIIIGHDTRFLGRRFAQEVAGVLAANGIRTYLAHEAVPTPVAAFGVKHFAASGAVMITASHNPPEYNGIKYIPDYAGPASPAITQAIEAEIQRIMQGGEVLTISAEEAASRKLLQTIVLKPHYEAHLRRMIQMDVIRQAHLRVVVDPMHGSGRGYLSCMLAEAGVEVRGIRDTADPFFGGSLPEPQEQHLTLLKQEVVKQKAALGLANDGDADRFGVVDRFGQYLSANAALVLLARHLIKNRGLRGRIVRTVATTHLLDRLAQRYDLELVETPVGFKHIGAEMLRGDVLIGGEESGGASILGHIPEKDGILINLLLAEMCAWEKKGIDQILRDVYDEYGELHSTRLDIPVLERRRQEQLLQAPPAKVGPYVVEEINRVDGMKLLLRGGHWVLIRPSGTEPLLRIYCEAASAEALPVIAEAVGDWFS
ncbi:phosphoglucomutase/phosphomannomutase family protein [Brevibacillus composti]|uniref:Phosphoglucomutase n=1 Tax=Brevibacillus composti TaxID=2796470 RepID=A0A7T5ENQ1_9BACL|nr:phosphoglucomutase/phosphomannomutase family protein [Brevibacillus composti]QQE75951.1 phosphoglucomutase/phosphomannomutase family protein [Brevibacillus composti]QUO42977.1 phosphoglucomutase/phosphomannomutase family protein [Brevibacillus composti]